MSIRLEENQRDFEAKLEMLAQAASSSSTLIDENLNTVSKWTFSWCILSLLRPFYTFFGKDVYSHVRVDRVAQSLLRYCNENKHFCDGPETIDQIKETILTPLNNRTAGKYGETIRRISSALHDFFPLCPAEWPSDLNISEIGIRPDQKTAIERAVLHLHQYRGSRWNFQKTGNRREVLIQKMRSTLRIPVPLSFHFHEWNGQMNALLLTKKVIGEGANRKAKLVINLTTGQTLIKKRVTSETETFVLNHLKDHPSQGIVRIYGLKKVNLPNKTQVLEYKYEKTLSEILDTSEITSIRTKINLITDLFSGLAALHNFSLHIQQFDSFPFSRYLSFPAYHGVFAFICKN